MKTACMACFKGFLSRLPLALLICLLAASTAQAQSAGALSPSLVLVLKRVSETHVLPTTGIVISDTGLVLVTEEFAAGDGSFVVLDGGTDIVSNGRPAIIAKRSARYGLAVLSVAGLTRPGMVLAEDAVTSQSRLHLEAFPPAEALAQGTQPLWQPFDILAGDTAVISPQTALPYVTGALLDNCGYLAGIQLTRGAQSMATDLTALAMFNTELGNALASMQFNVAAKSCRAQQATVTQAATETLEPPAPALESTGSVASDSGQGKPTPDLPVTPAPANHRPSIWHEVPLWLILPVILAVGLLVWKIVFFLRLPKAPGSADSLSLENNPRAIPVDEYQAPDMNALPANCDAVVVVEGVLPANTGFVRYCPVNTAGSSIVIGRSDADINIDHPLISPRHARLDCDPVSMTLSDLGSANGTFIRGIPCLPGEIMFIEPDDKIDLADVQIHIRMMRKEAQSS